MTRFGWMSALLGLAALTTACNTTSTPAAPVTLRGLVHLETNLNGGPTNVPAAQAAGRTLNLYASNAEWNRNLGSTVIDRTALPIATATIQGDLTYTLEAPGMVNRAMTSSISEVWPVPEFRSGNWLCAPSIEEVSDPSMRFVLASTQVMAGGALSRDVHLMFKADSTSAGQSYRLVRRGLMFVDRPGTVRLTYDCTSIYKLRLVMDVELTLQRGWNVLETDDLQESTANPQLTTNTTKVRARSVEGLLQDLYWAGEVVSF